MMKIVLVGAVLFALFAMFAVMAGESAIQSITPIGHVLTK